MREVSLYAVSSARVPHSVLASTVSGEAAGLRLLAPNALLPMEIFHGGGWGCRGYSKLRTHTALRKVLRS
jgi:hypothetical protein